MHSCDPSQEREDGLHILAPPAQRAVELVEDQKARLQALQKMIDLIAGAGQAAPASSPVPDQARGNELQSTERQAMLGQRE